MEQVVKKTPTRRDKTLGVMAKISACALAMALIFTSMAYYAKAAPLSIFLGILAIYFSFRLAKKLEIEYEYTFTNGELDIDKIIAQRKRKRLISFNVNQITEFGIWDDDMEVEADSTMVLASDKRVLHDFQAQGIRRHHCVLFPKRQTYRNDASLHSQRDKKRVFKDIHPCPTAGGKRSGVRIWSVYLPHSR